MNNKKHGFICGAAVIVLMCILFGGLPRAEAATVNWKGLYQSKVQQIENEYKRGKRKKNDAIAYFSLQDINFDGVPELYHALVSENENGYEIKGDSEEIYYIKNSRATLGKINAHTTLGLLPSFSPRDTLNDRNWQYAFYNTATAAPAFITKASWNGEENRGNVTISELTFNAKTGVLSSRELINGEYNSGEEPTYIDGYELIRSASTYSVSEKLDSTIWDWTPPYVIAEEKADEKSIATAKTWKDYYKEFILNKQYIKSKQKFYTNNSNGIVFALHDFDVDGVPEIIVKNGAVAENEMENYVYAYRNGKVTYIGTAGTLSADFRFTASADYPGLYWVSGADGEYNGYYYSVSGGKLEEIYVTEEKVNYLNGEIDYNITQKTSDDSLYNACKNKKGKLAMYNADEIIKMGWESFVNAALQADGGIYSDVVLNSWYYDAVEYMNERGIMSGVSETSFDPNTQITRAAFVTVLYRLEKEPSTSRVNFKDVPKDSWYEDAISWASRKGIANGVTDDMFAPDDKITREQLTAILYRYAKYKNKSVSTDEYNIKSFIDNNTVSEYAVDSMNWAVGAELISGTNGKRLEPFGMATRAQVAVILQRFCERYKL